MNWFTSELTANDVMVLSRSFALFSQLNMPLWGYVMGAPVYL